jgi:hypothetical protein
VTTDAELCAGVRGPFDSATASRPAKQLLRSGSQFLGTLVLLNSSPTLFR